MLALGRGRGDVGYLLLLLDFHPAPVLLGFVLGPRFEENFRRAMLISRGDALVFIKHPISAVFVALCVILIGAQIYVRLRKPKSAIADVAAAAAEREHLHGAEAHKAPVAAE